MFGFITNVFKSKEEPFKAKENFIPTQTPHLKTVNVNPHFDHFKKKVKQRNARPSDFMSFHDPYLDISPMIDILNPLNPMNAINPLSPFNIIDDSPVNSPSNDQHFGDTESYSAGSPASCEVEVPLSPGYESVGDISSSSESSSSYDSSSSSSDSGSCDCGSSD